MFGRILLDPTSTDGGGAAPNPTVTTGQSTPAPVATPQTVAIPLDQLNTLMSLPGKLAEYEAKWKQEEKQAQEKVTQALLAKGEAEKAVQLIRDQSTADITIRDQKIAESDKRARTYARDTALAQAIASIPNLRPGAAAHLTTILKTDLEAHPEGDGFAVRTALFKSAPDYLAEKLATPDFQCFLLPENGGGSGSTGANLTNPTVNANQAPLTPAQQLHERLMAQTNPNAVQEWMVPGARLLTRRN